jgi:hypothetical protein
VAKAHCNPGTAVGASITERSAWGHHELTATGYAVFTSPLQILLQPTVLRYGLVLCQLHAARTDTFHDTV